MTDKELAPQTQERRKMMVLRSALWAAAGDALGWITELSRGESGVRYRTGNASVSRPVAWTRTIGGRLGPRVDLPAGTYSDDTQLRLAVGRSIRGNGSFDVEAFAKIELTVWPTYALGGGLGTKAAASNLSRRGVNWFSNFFGVNGQAYTSSGGNGAAMRIQPHVWSLPPGSKDLLPNVLRNALVK
jgi:ADP-ribosylglycohydrolase